MNAGIKQPVLSSSSSSSSHLFLGLQGRLQLFYRQVELRLLGLDGRGLAAHALQLRHLEQEVGGDSPCSPGANSASAPLPLPLAALPSCGASRPPPDRPPADVSTV